LTTHNLAVMLKRLPPTLHSPTRNTATGCSKAPRVCITHWKSLAFAPGWCVRRILVRDSREVVTPFAKPSIKWQGIALA
jgi:hypothetical protein